MIRTVKDYEKLSEQYNKMLEERNSLIDDLSWYKAKVSRLERDNEKLEDEKGDYKAKYIIAKLHLKDVKDENILKNNLLSEISQHIGNKPSSSTYKYFRAKLVQLYHVIN
ncbi:hypothetical protein P1A28_13840 [Staphylococcus equorum]|uniref:hypothetical protein n=1 Tax=Staphylococcus equorum TaxID=246432 RepID=UPI002552ADE8|nr:hypothetical protein [Staphylococcus equorum]MDK9844763.1 hypothetical protein [Staphylococcus equorum]